MVQLGGEPRLVVAEDVLDRMTDRMHHRGPDDRGTYQEPGVAFGVRRLSIIDVASGHQPFASEDGRIWAVQNGELYNHPELRQRLVGEGHRFATRCDTEVLPHLYERYGTNFPRELRGKFAVALWDGRRRRAVLARDRLGVKPLYYARSGDVVVFASELKSLLASGIVATELDYEAIDAYLNFGFVPGPLTPLRGVAKLMPGHLLVIDSAGVRVERYWNYPEPCPDEGMNAAAAAEGLIEVLEESVRLRLMSDVPLGSMLSGGLDSSLITALMARNMSGSVKTFSVGFVEDGKNNELQDARRVAQALGADHHELELSISDRSLDLEDLVWWMDEPLADLSALGFLALCELATRHVTVALSGQGADELLGGYRKHRAASIVGAMYGLPVPIRSALRGLAPRLPATLARSARTLAARGVAERLVAMSSQLDGESRRSLTRGPLAALDGSVARRVVEERAGGVVDDPLPATLFVDGQLALVDDMLHYFDRASMAHSLEARVPFLDHRVVEYCATIPAGLKVRRLNTKYVLKEAARGLVPDDIIDKRKIGFFRYSVVGWLRAQTDNAVTEYLLDANPATAEFLDPQGVRRLVEAHVRGADSEHTHLVLAILMLEVWLRSFVPRATAVWLKPSRERIEIPA